MHVLWRIHVLVAIDYVVPPLTFVLVSFFKLNYFTRCIILVFRS